MKTIEFIKDEFSKATPILYKYKGCPLQNLMSRDFNKATNITLTDNINECKNLSFTVPFTKDRKLDYNSNELLVYFSGIYFIIKDIATDTNSQIMNVTCEEICTELKGIFCKNINIVGATAETIFNAIITATQFTNIGYSWLGTDIPNTTKKYLVTDTEVSCYENLVSLAKVFNGSIEFSYDSLGQGYVYLRKNPISTGKFIKKNIDMKSLTITSNSNEIFTRIEPKGYTNENGIILDIQEVNNGNPILEDFSYYKSLGVPDDIISQYPQYKQIKKLQNDKYKTASDLLTYAQEELAKCCKPQFTAEATISDLAVFIDNPIESPKVNMSLKVIDKSINFIFDCLIIGVERNYNNPIETKLTISTIIPYSTSFQSLQYTSDIISKVVSTTEGTPTINIPALSGTINTQNIKLKGTVDSSTTTAKQSTLAILFEDKRTDNLGAIGLGTKGLCIANELNEDGTWKWQTFGTYDGFNASLIKTGILKSINEYSWINIEDGTFKLLNNKLYSNNGFIEVPTQPTGTSDKQIANTEFVTNALTTKADNTDNTRTTTDKTVTGAINELNARQNIIVNTQTVAITAGVGSINLTISGLGTNPIMVTNGDYSLNTAQILGITHTATTDTITVNYSNGIAGNCKFNFTYSK